MYWDEEPYYEPTPADEIFYDAQQKLMECLKDSVKHRIDLIKAENEELKKQNDEWRRKIAEVDARERRIQQREDEFERNAMRRKFSEMLKPMEEQMTIWRVEHDYAYGEKCNKCNDDRNIEFTSPQGTKMTERCQCARQYTYYYPCEAVITVLALYKDSSYPYSVRVQPQYDSASYDNSYCKFKLETYIENLDEYEDVETVLEEITYTNVGFKRMEDCQRYADYLNRRNKVPQKVIKIVSKSEEYAPKKCRKAVKRT